MGFRIMQGRVIFLEEQQYSYDIDRRVLKTRAFINDALLTLLAENSFDNITVRAICDLAMINRSTFYSHYVDKFDLFNQLIKGKLELFSTVLNKHPFTFMNEKKALKVDPCFYHILLHVNENATSYKLLLAHDDTKVFAKSFARLIEESVISYLGDSAYASLEHSGPSKIFKCFLTNTIVSMVNNWLQYKHQYTPHEFALEYTQIVHKSI